MNRKQHGERIFRVMRKMKTKRQHRTENTSRALSKKVISQRKIQKSPRISVCMIVKNEEALLPQCLKSINGFADEIIVVDTGSTDRTVAIAESFGAKIYHHPWEHDFSKHRNQSLSYATGDWILQLDADEEMVEGSGPILRDTVQEGLADYYYCSFLDIDRHGEVKAAFNLIRLFRNNMGMQFTRKVHNQLQVVGKGDFSHIRLNHYGYDLSPEKMEAKYIRTTTLLKKAIADNPEDGYNYHQLAASYSMHKDYSEVIKYGEIALDLHRRMNLDTAFYVNTFYLVAAAYYELKDLESAARVGLEAEAVFGGHLDTCHILSAVYFKMRMLDPCKKQSRRYLDIYQKLLDNPALIGRGICYTHSTAKRSQIFMGLACSFFMEQDIDTADKYFHKSFEDAGRQMDKAENVYRFYLEKNIQNKALLWLTIAYETGTNQEKVPSALAEYPGLYLKIANQYLTLTNTKALHQCLECVQDNQLTLEEQIEKRLLQIRSLWNEGAIEKLIQKLESLLTMLGVRGDRCLDSLDDLAGIFYDLSELLAEQQRWHLAEPTLKIAIQMAPNCFEPERFQAVLVSATL